MSYHHLKRRWAVVLALTTVVPAAALEDPAPPEGPTAPEDLANVAKAMRNVSEFGVEIKKLGDSSVQADLIDEFVDKLWERNAWNTESDLFAKRLNHEIARIPPWQFKRRLNKLSDMVAERYEFSTGQELRYQAKTFSEIIGFVVRNAGVISQHVGEYVNRRINNKPVSAEDVQRWTRESQPLVDDFLTIFGRVNESMQRDMNPRQRQLLERDLESFDRQMEYIKEQRASWARGEWRPEDWGLENDPIQMGLPTSNAGDTRLPGSVPLSPTARPRAYAPPNTMALREPYVPEDESTWAVYVRRFIKTHGLDAGQRDAIRSILAELESRAAQYRRLHAGELAAVPGVGRATAEAFAPIRDMFAELKARAQGLLTEPQRTADKK